MKITLDESLKKNLAEDGFKDKRKVYIFIRKHLLLYSSPQYDFPCGRNAGLPLLFSRWCL